MDARLRETPSRSVVQASRGGDHGGIDLSNRARSLEGLGLALASHAVTIGGQGIDDGDQRHVVAGLPRFCAWNPPKRPAADDGHPQLVHSSQLQRSAFSFRPISLISPRAQS